ncbi:uncharacterized protein LOC123523673 [Mercenaria mercenaria]|uniref:uncharacterized protein LOC123523673 n=1 Tax=Mercenaria mercenaria TaxID=6596 RepID=UPI00234F518A|nr:uncharacterized protein LOC123523673 [Mercenaria mercenaria]XP_045157260.2 uncharacterized protein LOC123523673 [Mercenaria mercenaria]
MENGIIPLRHGSLPGALRLPKRYEKFTKEKMSPASKRKSSTAFVHEETEDDQLRDMMQAIMWVKQELILLRQHDILLKRQFCDIQHTINTMNKSRKYRKSPATDSNTSLQSNEGSDFGLDNYSVRSASSVTALDGTDTEEDDEIYRPRTSSMKTTRDLTALARRRGSKELI